jgi:hypothetical protein
MKAYRLSLAAAFLCGMIAVFDGCAGRDAGAPSASSPATMVRQTGARVGAYVTQANGGANGVVFGYPAGNKSNAGPECSISGQKFDHSQIAVDAAGNLYLPNISTGVISVYAPNCGRLIGTVTDPYGADGDVALGTNTFYAVGGTHVAVCTMTGCASELTDPSVRQLETAAVDSQGNVWASYYNVAGAPSLIVWPNGSMPGHVVTGYVNQNTPGDLIFDKSGTLLSLQSLFDHVYIYRCDAATATCTNTRTVKLKYGSLFGALNAKNTVFQAADYPNNSVSVYAYPEFKYEYSYNRGLMQGYSVQGIAVVR